MGQVGLGQVRFGRVGYGMVRLMGMVWSGVVG